MTYHRFRMAWLHTTLRSLLTTTLTTGGRPFYSTGAYWMDIVVRGRSRQEVAGGVLGGLFARLGSELSEIVRSIYGGRAGRRALERGPSCDS